MRGFTCSTLLSVATLLAAFVVAVPNACSADPVMADTALPIPPLAANTSTDANTAEFDLVAQEGRTSFVPDRPAMTYGYNGPFLGPTLRIRRGQHVQIHVHNVLTQVISTHWHGIVLPGDMDGGPRQLIYPSKEWLAQFDVNQPAATCWYHPHLDGGTAQLVYAGLAGMIIIDDDISDKLRLPHRYGVDDVPLILQDRRIDDIGQSFYFPNVSDLIEGFQGDVLLANGVADPTFVTPATKVRFRLLNASNARVYHLHLNDDSLFWQIATDGGLMEAPVPLKELTLAPGERAEVVVDFVSRLAGSDWYWMTDVTPVLKCHVNGPAATTAPPLPARLAHIDWISAESSQLTRPFVLQSFGVISSINGRRMDIDRMDATVRLHDTEIWTISTQHIMAAGGMRHDDTVPHCFHVHGVQFQVLERDNKPPPPSERGWKDTVAVLPGEQVRIIMRFDEPGIFMFHCQVLEHEDGGMMGQFEVK